ARAGVPLRRQPVAGGARGQHGPQPPAQAPQALPERVAAGPRLHVECAPPVPRAGSRAPAPGPAWPAGCSSEGIPQPTRENAMTLTCRSLCAALALSYAGLAGCVVGSDNPPRTSAATGANVIDADGDGQPDGVDLDGDGVADVDFGDLCDEPIVDEDGDGVPEGIDFDCDGNVDIALCAEPLVDDDGDGT